MSTRRRAAASRREREREREEGNASLECFVEADKHSAHPAFADEVDDADVAHTLTE